MKRALALAAIACGSGGNAAPSSGGASPGWHDDLVALEDALAHHPNKAALASWKTAATELDGVLAKLDDAHAATELVRLAARLGDSHTRVFFPSDKVYPVRFLGFDDGIFLAGGGEAWAIGKKVVAINGKPIADVLALLTPLVAHDNQPHLDAELPALLESPVAMAGVDLTTGDLLTVTLADGDKTRDLVLSPSKPAMLAPPKELPLHLQGPTNLGYWNKYDADHALVYLQYNQCADDKRVGPFAKFAADTLAFVDGHKVDRFVVDLRSNMGGNSQIIEPLIEGLAQRKLPTYVLVGRVTFSSGLLAATELAAKAGAKLVGTPTGGNPNSYGEIKVFTLPHSKLVGQYSTKRFEDANHPGDTVTPDVVVHVVADDWFSGRDPAMDAALK